ncbi:MAG TPA: hypothetical protein VFG20_09805, partial [Planctomycetaceae bacterium]|nr:hypothetical protein [Planctomycetaceae bacterium]
MASRAKTADRQSVLKKLLPLLKKQYKITVCKLDRPVMETMLYAVCLENASVEDADRAYARLSQFFPDLNEARVSSISELEPVFEGMEDRDWRGFRVRSVLQYVFEKSFNFELESLKKKTLELATKQLGKIRHLSPFIRNFALQQAIGAHILPLDDATARLLVWLGLVSPGQSIDEMGESLKAVVRKAEALPFLFSVRALAVDPKLKAAFDPAVYPQPEGGHEPDTAIDRLTELFKSGLSAIKAKKVEPVASKTTAKPVKPPKPAPPAATAKKPAPAPAKAAPVKSAAKTTPKKAPPAKPAVAKG